MKTQFQIDKKDIYALVSYAFKEYGSMTIMKNEMKCNGFIIETFGTIKAKISMVIAEKKHLYLRRYDVSNMDGELIFSFILGHAAMLFSNSAHKFREELIASEKIKVVATLKKSVFNHIVIPAAVIILGDNKETCFTAVESIETLVDIMNGEFHEDAKVYHSNNISPNNLLPEFYNGDAQVIEDSFKGSETKELGEVATVIAGKGAKRNEYADTGIPYLRARDIQNGKIQKVDVLYIAQENVMAFSRQLLQEGDILLTKNFGQNKLALVTEDDIPAIASNALFIIRPIEISEGYLYRYLASETGNQIEKFRSNYLDVDNEPLYPFGYGLSYTTFNYGDITLDRTSIPMDGSLTAKVILTNTGNRDGAEVVQLYIRDKVAESTRPVKELKGFQKVFLKAGESREITFKITPDLLKYYNYELQYVAEPGAFDLMIGTDSQHVKTATFVLH